MNKRELVEQLEGEGFIITDPDDYTMEELWRLLK